DGGGQNGGVDLAVGAGGGSHDDLVDAGHLGGDNVHQHGGGVGRGAAGHVDAGLLDGGVLLPQQHAGGALEQDILVDLLLVEGADIVGGRPQGLDKVRLDGGERLVDLGLADPQVGKLG